MVIIKLSTMYAISPAIFILDKPEKSMGLLLIVILIVCDLVGYYLVWNVVTTYHLVSNLV